MNFINALLWAVGVAIIVFLIGVLLSTIAPVAAFGAALQQYAWLIGIVSGIFQFVGRGRYWNK